MWEKIKGSKYFPDLLYTCDLDAIVRILSVCTVGVKHTLYIPMHDHSIGKKMGSRSITTLLIQKTCLKCSIENLNLYDVSV